MKRKTIKSPKLKPIFNFKNMHVAGALGDTDPTTVTTMTVTHFRVQR